MAVTNSPLRYPGGKSSLSSFLSETITLNGLKNVSYAEPFAGGAGAALNLLFEHKVRDIYINDADILIYNFWKSITCHKDQFLELLETTPITIEKWHEYKKIISEPSAHTDIEIGFATFFLNRCNRSGILKANPIGGLTQNGKWKLDARFEKSLLTKKINKIMKHSSDIHVSNHDALDFINEIESNCQSFIFIDPPYYVKGRDLYLNYYYPKDHLALAQRLKQFKSPWVMTYDATLEIKQMYEWCTIKDFTLNYFAKSHKKGNELIIHQRSLITPDSITPSYGLIRKNCPHSTSPQEAQL